ncbi:MAG: hypothetical protein PVJ34_18995 [Anaerolineae bacterium]|jgi:hypothetical protein
MPEDNQQHLHHLLHQLPGGGLEAAAEFFCTGLGCRYVGASLPRDAWPDRTRAALAGDPLLLARRGSATGALEVVYVPLAPGVPSEAAQRLAITQLEDDRLHEDGNARTLYLLSNPEQRGWHLVHARRDGDVPASLVLTRLAIAPHARLHAAAERLALLAHPDPPLAAVFDPESLAAGFFSRLLPVHDLLRAEITSSMDAGLAVAWSRDLLFCLLLLYLLQALGWLAGEPDYLYRRFLAGYAGDPAGAGYGRDVLGPLLRALADPAASRDLRSALGPLPPIGSDLLDLDPRPLAAVTNGTFAALFRQLFEYYDFTAREDTPLDRTLAVGPGMLATLFERLLPAVGQGPAAARRQATGVYYTPRPVVAFMCRQALAETLSAGDRAVRARLARLLALPAPAGLNDTQRAWLAGAFSRDEAADLRSHLLDLRACDPAAGAGAFLLGLLQTMARAAHLLDWRLHGDAGPGPAGRDPGVGRHLVHHCLHGADLQPRALGICRLRLWLALAAAGPPAAEPLPLPDLGARLRPGDSLLAPPFAPDRDLPRGGFDLLLGNPPYGTAMPRPQWQQIMDRYPVAAGARNVSAAFLALAFDWLQPGGVACQIVPKSISYSHGWRRVREMLWGQGSLLASADASLAFEGVQLEQEIVLYRVRPGLEDRPRGWHLGDGAFLETYAVPLAVLKQHDAIANHLSPAAGRLVERLSSECRPMHTCTETLRGGWWQKHLISGEDLPSPEGAGPDDGVSRLPILRGRDLRQFAINPDLPRLRVRPFMAGKLARMARPKIVSQNLVAHLTRPYDTLVPISAVDRAGLAALDTVNLTLPLPDCPYPLEFLAALLNSSFARWYFYFVLYNHAVRTVHFDRPYVSRLPLPGAPPAQVGAICDLVVRLERRQAARPDKYLLPGQDPVYDQLDGLILDLYHLSPSEIDLIMRQP